MDKLTPDQEKIIRLRDAFNAGKYSLVKYCIYNNIKKLLVLSYHELFIWELANAYRLEKSNILIHFAKINSQDRMLINFSVACVTGPFNIKSINNGNFDLYHKIIILTTNKLTVPQEKSIYFDKFLNQIITEVYADQPLRFFQSLHPYVKIICTNAPWNNNLKNKKSVFEIKNELKNRHSL